MRRAAGAAFALVAILVTTSCAASAPPASAAPTAGAVAATAGPLARLRARNSLIVSIRLTAPASGGQQQLDVAHAQKRALESAIATQLALRIIGPDARVEFRELGRERSSLVQRGEADLAMTTEAETPPANVVFSEPYAAGGLVLVVKGGSTATDAPSLAGQVIAATTTGEANANEAAQRYFRGRGIAATFSPMPGLAAAIAALDGGLVTAVVGDRTGIAVLQRGRAEPLRVIAEVADHPYVIAIRKDEVSLQAAVDSVLNALVTSSEIQTLATAAGFPYEGP